MAKLIHAASLVDVKKSTSLYSSNAYTDSAKKSIIFTNDGYIVTLGHEYYIGTAAKGNLTTGTTITNGKIKVVDGLGNSLSGTDGVLLPVWKLSSGNVITVSNSNGDWTINHNLRVKVGTETEVTSNTLDVALNGFNAGAGNDTYNITPSLFSFDKYGHISATGTGTAISVDKITDLLVTNGSASASNNYYLLGSNSSAASTEYYKPYKSGKLYVSIDQNGNTTLHADNIAASSITSSATLTVAQGGTGATTLTKGGVLYGNGTDAIGSSKGVAGLYLVLGENGPEWKTALTSIDLTHTANTNTTLVTEAAVADAISKGFAANDAMVFKGTIAKTSSGTNKVTATVYTLPSNGYSAGYTYRIAEAGIYAGQTCEVGDLIIAVTDGPTSGTTINNAHWTVVQTNIDGAVTTTDTLTANLLIIGNGSKTLKSLAVGTEGQVLRIVKSGNELIPQWSADLPNREIKVGNTTVSAANSTNAVSFAAGDCIKVAGTTNTVTYSHKDDYTTHESGLYKITVDKYGHVSAGTSWDPNSITFKSVKTAYNATSGDADKTYDPDGTALSIGYGRGIVAYLNNNVITFGHENNITALTTAKLGSITYDEYGHITGFTEVTSLNNPNSLSFLNNAGTTIDTYDGSTAKTLKFLNGTDISLTTATTKDSNLITITPSITHKYKTISYKTSSTGTATSVSGNTTTGFTLVAGSNISLSHSSTELTISSTNTWRDIQVYKIVSSAQDGTIDGLLDTEAKSIDTAPLKFSSVFSVNAKNEIDLVWGEVDSNGDITYSV